MGISRRGSATEVFPLVEAFEDSSATNDVLFASSMRRPQPGLFRYFSVNKFKKKSGLTNCSKRETSATDYNLQVIRKVFTRLYNSLSNEDKITRFTERELS